MSAIQDYLTDYRQKADCFLDKFFAQEEKRASQIAPFCSETVRLYREFMRGGKMARGALVCLGYESAGGEDQEAIMTPSVAVEIIHSFILIHDDWIDNDLRRRGKPTVHQQFAKIYQKRFKGERAEKWAANMAIILGDLGCWWGYKLINGAKFPPEKKVLAIASLCDNLAETGYGQFLDITYDLESGFDWEKIIKIRRLKSAYYTFVMPLMVGISLASGDGQKLKAAQEFGFPAGIAFQLRDDYLGLFGQETITGKSASSDLKEGKKTLLVAKALETLKGEERKILKGSLGKRDLSGKETDRLRKIIKNSGAVTTCQGLVKNLSGQAKGVIGKLTTDSRLKKIYLSLIDYLAERKK